MLRSKCYPTFGRELDHILNLVGDVLFCLNTAVFGGCLNLTRRAKSRHAPLRKTHVAYLLLGDQCLLQGVEIGGDVLGKDEVDLVVGDKRRAGILGQQERD